MIRTRDSSAYCVMVLEAKLDCHNSDLWWEVSLCQSEVSLERVEFELLSLDAHLGLGFLLHDRITSNRAHWHSLHWIWDSDLQTGAWSSLSIYLFPGWHLMIQTFVGFVRPNAVNCVAEWHDNRARDTASQCGDWIWNVGLKFLLSFSVFQNLLLLLQFSSYSYIN